MWTTLQDQAFLLGAALIMLVHATKFDELNLGNPVTGRYLALLPGAKVRDFVGPYAYHIALFSFLVVSFVSYYLCCQNFTQHSQRRNQTSRHRRRGQNIPGCSVPVVYCGSVYWPHATGYSSRASVSCNETSFTIRSRCPDAL